MPHLFIILFLAFSGWFIAGSAAHSIPNHPQGKRLGCYLGFWAGILLIFLGWLICIMKMPQ